MKNKAEVYVLPPNLIFNLHSTTISRSIASHLCANFALIQQAFNKYWSVLFSIRDSHGLCLVIVCGRFNIHSWGSSLMGCVHKLRLKYFIQRWVWSLGGCKRLYRIHYREMPKNAWDNLLTECFEILSKSKFDAIHKHPQQQKLLKNY